MSRHIERSKKNQGLYTGASTIVLARVDMARNSTEYGPDAALMLSGVREQRKREKVSRSRIFGGAVISAAAAVAATAGFVAMPTPAQAAGYITGTTPGFYLNMGSVGQNVDVTQTGDVSPYGVFINGLGTSYDINFSSYSNAPPSNVINNFWNSYNGNGLDIESSGGNITVNMVGDGTGTPLQGQVSGYYDGMYITTNGNGTIDIHASGIQIGTYDTGIYTSTQFGDTTIVVDHHIYAGNTGVAAYSWSGDVSVTTHGGISYGNATTPVAYAGIFAGSKYGNVSVTTDSTGSGANNGAIVASQDGIDAISLTENVNIQSGADIIAGNDGVMGVTGNGSVSITTTGNISAGGDGIYGNVAWNGGGDLYIHADPATIYSGSDAIHAVSSSSTGDVTVINEDNLGSSIYHIGDHGIFARNYNSSSTGDVTVLSTGNIYSYNDGINARTYGFGNVSVGTAANPVTGNISSFGTSSWDYGIVAQITNTGSSGTVSVYTGTGNITAWSDGIRAYSNGNGAGAVIVDANMTNITSSNADGISAEAWNSQNTGGVSVTTYGGQIYAAGNGIWAVTNGNGTVTVNNGDNIGAMDPGGNGNYAVGDHGIFARNFSYTSTSDVKVYSHGNIYSNNDGINARTNGYGDVMVGSSTNRVSGNITSYGTSSWDNGIVADVWNNASSGNVSVFTGTGTINSYGAGILAYNEGLGAVTVDTDGTNITSRHNDGIVAAAWNTQNTGGVSVTTAGGQIYAYGNGIFAFTNGNGPVTVNNGDNIGAAGAYGNNAVGDHGIFARIYNSSSSADVTVYSHGNIYSINDGINARTNGTGNVTVGTTANRVTGDITAYKDWSGYGIVARIVNSYSSGNVEVATGAGTITSGNYSDGINAINEGFGSVLVDGNGTNIVAGDHGIFARDTRGNSTGDVSVYFTGAGSITSVNDGINARTYGYGNVTVGSSSNRVNATINSTGTSSWDNGIVADVWNGNSSGSVSVYTGGGSIHSYGDGILAYTFGLGKVTVDTNATTITSTEYNGIVASAWNYAGTNTGGVSVKTVGGKIYADNGTGIIAVTDGLGSVTVTNGAAIGSSGHHVGDHGIFARSYNSTGTGAVTVFNTGNIFSYNDGINARTLGYGNVIVGTSGSRIAGTINTFGTTVWDDGIVASSVNGNASGSVNVYTGSGSIHSVGDGILAYTFGKGKVTVDTSSTTITSTAYDGIVASAWNINGNNTGGVSVKTVGGKVYADNGDGIFAYTNGLGSVSVTNGATLGSNSHHIGYDGIDAVINNSSSTGSVTVLNTGSITSYADGIRAVTNGHGAVSVGTSGSRITGTIKSFGLGYDGIYASITNLSSTANVQVYTGSETVTASHGDAIYAYNRGGGRVIVNTSSTNLSSPDGDGLVAISHYGNASNAVTVTTSGGSFNTLGNGIVAIDESVGSVTVNTGTTNITSSGASAIYAKASNGSAFVHVTTSGTVKGLGGNTSPVIDIISPASGSSTLTISGGTVESDSISLSDLAVKATGGSITVTNNGTLKGRVDFSGLAGSNHVTFNNNSSTSWHTSGTSYFSNGNDVLNNNSSGLIGTDNDTTFDFLNGTDAFNNSGTLVVGEAGTGYGTALTLTYGGTLTFNNSGSIVMGTTGSTGGTTTDGVTGDRLLASGVAFVSSGSSALFVDTSLGATTQTDCTTAAVSDCIVIGASSGTGTGIHVNDTNSANPGSMNLGGILVVDASSYSDANDFYLAGSNVTGSGTPDAYIQKGMFDYHLILDAPNANWDLVSLPNQGAMEFTHFMALLQNIWYQTSEGWEERTAELRHGHDTDDGNPLAAKLNSSLGWSVWGKALYSNTTRDNSLTLTALNSNFTYDTSYRQRVGGFELGTDYTRRGSNNSMLSIGGFFSYVDSTTRFNVTDDHARIKGGQAAAYLSYLSGPWFADVMVKDDYDHFTANLKSIPLTVGKQANSIGGKLVGGYHWSDARDQLVVEPLLSIAYVSTNLPDLNEPGADFNYGTGESLRGRAAVRVSRDFANDKIGGTLQPFLLGGVVQEFEGKNTMTIVSGGDSLKLTDRPTRTMGNGVIGLNFFGHNGLTAFARGEFLFGSHQSTEAIKIGVKYTIGEEEAAPPPPPPPPPAPPPPPPPPPPPVKTFIVFFDFNKSNLTEEAQAVVTEAVKAAKEGNVVQIKVTGHTDTVGSASYNQALSVRRADAVKDEMVRQGMNGDTIAVEGKGFSEPLVPTGPGVREPQNRRAVIDLGDE